MDRTTVISSVLFHAFCIDMDIVPPVEGSRFDPFPGGLPPELDRDAYLRHNAVCSLFKKSEIEGSVTSEEATLRKFSTANDACRRMNLEGLDMQDCTLGVGYALAKSRQLLDRWFCSHGDAISMAAIEKAARFGPGGSVGMKGQPTQYYFKIGDAPLTATSDFVRSWYKLSVSYVPLCEAAEMAREARWGEIQLREQGNLAFVPKSYAVKRIVVMEPSCNTYFQFGLGRVMEGLLCESTGIDLSLQDGVNADLARVGSITGGFCTMDLRQCSDYISIAVVKALFPPSLVRWFNTLRTKVVRLPKKYGGQDIGLHMLSTMGNGFTFPMQTALLAALIHGVYDTLDIPILCAKGEQNWGVFGDDIVVVPKAWHLLCRVLEKLGMIVNTEKSFNSGPFRESCGTDWYSGVDVRAIYFRKYATDQDLYSCYNRLAIWGAKHALDVSTTLATILTFIQGTTTVVPPDAGLTAGLMVPHPPVEPNDKGCWTYHAWEPAVDSFSFEPWSEWYERDFLPSVEDSREYTRRFKRWLSDLRRLCNGSVNEPAVLKALLAKYVRRTRVVIKSEPRYRLSGEQLTPRWGYADSGSVPLIGTECFDRWNELVRLSFAKLPSLV